MTRRFNCMIPSRNGLLKPRYCSTAIRYNQTGRLVRKARACSEIEAKRNRGYLLSAIGCAGESSVTRGPAGKNHSSRRLAGMWPIRPA